MTAQNALEEIRLMTQPCDGETQPLGVEQVKEVYIMAGEALVELSHERDKLSHQRDNLFAQVRAALVNAPATCPYHGTDFEFLGMERGEPRCDSCKQPFRVSRGLATLCPASVVRDPANTPEET